MRCIHKIYEHKESNINIVLPKIWLDGGIKQRYLVPHLFSNN